MNAVKNLSEADRRINGVIHYDTLTFYIGNNLDYQNDSSLALLTVAGKPLGFEP